MRPDNQVLKKKYEKRELGVLNKTLICRKFELPFVFVQKCWRLSSLVVASFEIRGTLGSSLVSGSAKCYA